MMLGPMMLHKLTDRISGSYHLLAIYTKLFKNFKGLVLY